MRKTTVKSTVKIVKLGQIRLEETRRRIANWARL